MKKSTQNLLIILSAPSGAGKTTLCARALEHFPELSLSISTTTRALRGQEKEGVHYYFTTVEDFKSRIERGEFAEWANVHGNYYGTSKQALQKAFQDGKSVLLDIDVQGAESLKQSFPDETYLIFISPPSLEALEARLRARGTESEENLARRMKNARHEMLESHKFDRTIVNDTLEQASNELITLLESVLRGPK